MEVAPEGVRSRGCRRAEVGLDAAQARFMTARRRVDRLMAGSSSADSTHMIWLILRLGSGGSEKDDVFILHIERNGLPGLEGRNVSGGKFDHISARALAKRCSAPSVASKVSGTVTATGVWLIISKSRGQRPTIMTTRRR